MDRIPELIVGNTYCLRMNIGRDDLPKEHPFIWNRVMRYEGIDKYWKYDKSYIFSDEIDLYDILGRKDAVDYNVFVGMTMRCSNRIENGRWYIHISNRIIDDKPTFEVFNIE
jgi:hypothetical protein